MTEYIDYSDPETQDRLEREPDKKERWELVEEKANELMLDPEWIEDTMCHFGLFNDFSAYVRGDDDICWKIRRVIQAYAKQRAEDLV